MLTQGTPPIEIEVTWYELAVAANVGVLREVLAIKEGRRHIAGYAEEFAFFNNYMGAIGELVVAKARNQFWNGSVNTFKDGADVGDMQVRFCKSIGGELLVRPGDSNAEKFALVTPSNRDAAVGTRVFLLVGWMYGADAKREEWKAARGGRKPAYFVPQQFLTPFYVDSWDPVQVAVIDQG